MCGIAGIFRFDGGITPEDAAAVRTMSQVQRHRGPDDHGFFEDSRVALSHRRLSIIDVSSSSHQPMSNEDASVWVIFNGEIYNYPELREELRSFGHVFRSRSDTEVLVHGYEQWGAEGLFARLRGMFGIALYDSRCGRLFLVRDRAGIKPVYYTESPGLLWIAFASETKALKAANLTTGEWDMDALAGFLLYGSIASPRTTSRNVLSVLPGHYLLIDRRGSVMRRYRNPSPGFEYGGKPSIPAVRGILADAVKRHLVSDVPLGLFLSGGMDSVGLLAMIVRMRTAPLTTLTVTFDGSRSSEASEGEEARQVARQFGTDHREVRLRNSDFTAEFPKFLAAMDQPSIDGLNTYFISKAARDAGLVAVLSGLGGDEVFWGYKHYQWFRTCGAARLLGRLPAPARGALLKSLAAYGRVAGQERWLRVSALRNGMSSRNLYFVARGLFSPEQVSRLLGLDASHMQQVLDSGCDDARCEDSGGQEDHCENGFGPKRADPAAFNRVETKRYLQDQLLRDTDVYSMSHSIEVRVPYLDQEVVPLAARFTSSEKLRGGMNKPILAELIDDPLVWASARRKKQGFALPLEEWLHSSLNELLEVPMQADFLEKRAASELLENFRARRVPWSRAWSLIVLGAHAANRCSDRIGSVH